MSKIPVGISTCLLGKEVRHDGGHKHSRYCTEVLSRYFEFRSLCPELEAGLGVPRPAIHLRESDDGLRLVEVKKQCLSIGVPRFLCFGCFRFGGRLGASQGGHFRENLLLSPAKTA